MNLPVILAMSAALVAGLAQASQAPINAQLGKALNGPLAASSFSFVLSAVLIVVIAALSGAFRQIGAVEGAPWWLWIGGLLGPVYMIAVIYAVPTVGVVSTLAALVAGQLLGATVIDLVGAFGVEARAISLPRLLAVVLAFAGVLLSRF